MVVVKAKTLDQLQQEINQKKEQGLKFFYRYFSEGVYFAVLKNS